MNSATPSRRLPVTTPLRRIRRFLADAVTAAECQPTPALRGYPFTER